MKLSELKSFLRRSKGEKEKEIPVRDRVFTNSIHHFMAEYKQAREKYESVMRECNEQDILDKYYEEMTKAESLLMYTIAFAKKAGYNADWTIKAMEEVAV